MAKPKSEAARELDLTRCYMAVMAIDPGAGDWPPLRVYQWKELADKLRWAIGSTLAMGYGRNSSVYAWADRQSAAIMGRQVRSDKAA